MRRDASKSTTDIQKEDDAAHATAELVEAMQWRTEMEDQGSGWNARERIVIAKMKQYLNDSDCVKLEMEELEFCTWSRGFRS